MTIIPIASDYFYRTPAFDGLQFNSLAKNNTYVPNERLLELETSGLNITLTGPASGGALYFQGRLILFKDEIVSVPTNTNTKLVVTWDTTKDNTYNGTIGEGDYDPVNNQVTAGVKAFATVGNINDNATTADVILANIQSSSTSLTITKNLKVYAYDASAITITDAYTYQGLGDIVYINGQFDVDIRAGSTSLVLPELPAGRRPAKQETRWIKLDQNDAKIIFNPSGQVSLDLNFISSYAQKYTCDLGSFNFVREAGIDTN